MGRLGTDSDLKAENRTSGRVSAPDKTNISGREITWKKKRTEVSSGQTSGFAISSGISEFLEGIMQALSGLDDFPSPCGLRLILHNRQYHTPAFHPDFVYESMPIKKGPEQVGRLDLGGKSPLKLPFQKRTRQQVGAIMFTAASEIANFNLGVKTQTAPPSPEEIYRLVLTSISDAVLMTDSEGIFTFICAADRRIFGYSYEEIFDLYNIKNLLGNDIHPKQNDNRGHEIRNIECAIRDRDGQNCVALINYKKIDFDRASCLYTCHDITRLREAEKAQSQLASIVESSYDAIIGMDLDGNIMSWNNGACEIYGYRADEIVGMPIQTLIPPEKSGEIEQVLNKIKKCERLDQYETIRIAKNGSRFDASVTLSPIKDKQARVAGVSAIIRDISLQRKAEREMHEAYDKLETERTVLKEIMSHIEEDKRKIEEQIQANYNRIVMPLLHSLKEKSGPEDSSLLELLENSLFDITSPFINTLDSNFARLSPRELGICNMIKNGLSSKEISDSLSISILTVHKFRQQIRKKLGLANKAVNLTSFLKTIS